MRKKIDNKGQARIGDYLIGFVLFIMIITTGFLGYVSFLNDNNAEVSSSVNTTKLLNIYDNYANESNSNSALYTIQNKSNVISPVAGLDFLSTGIDSIKVGFETFATSKDLVSFMRSETPLKYLPPIFFSSWSAILVITAVFITIGAIWRYDMKK